MGSRRITELTRPGRDTWYRVVVILVGACALAVPASATASPDDNGYSSVNAISGGSSEASEPIDGWSYSLTHPSASSPTTEPSPPYSSVNGTVGADGLGQPTGVVGGSPASTGNGFDWPSAVIGAGAAMALAALGGAALLTLRRRTAISPSASTS